MLLIESHTYSYRSEIYYITRLSFFPLHLLLFAQNFCHCVLCCRATHQCHTVQMCLINFLMENIFRLFPFFCKVFMLSAQHPRNKFTLFRVDLLLLLLLFIAIVVVLVVHVSFYVTFV